jgi:hypothetical protein
MYAQKYKVRVFGLNTFFERFFTIRSTTRTADSPKNDSALESKNVHVARLTY